MVGNIAIILLAFCPQDLTKASVDKMVVDKLVDRLRNGEIKPWPPLHVDLDHTTLAKPVGMPSKGAMSPQIVLRSHFALPLRSTQTSEANILSGPGARDGGLTTIRRGPRAPRSGVVRATSSEVFKEDPVRRAVEEIEEPAAREALSRVQQVPVKVPEYISEGPIMTSFFRFGGDKGGTPRPAVILLHGFDSSCIEFRRLAPLLEGGADVYGFDILGWGFNQLRGIDDFSPSAKTDHLHAFIQQHIKRPVVLVGASLGGAVAIDCATRYPSTVEKLVFIDAQGFIRGAGPASSLPEFFAKAGIALLKSWPLRNFANQISYYKPKQFATQDAVRIGRLHCYQEGWDEASLSFLNSGGYIVDDRIANVSQPTLVLWGSQDKILDPAFADRFKDTLPNCAGLHFIEECGHVPHLEQPVATANLIQEFLGLSAIEKA